MAKQLLRRSGRKESELPRSDPGNWEQLCTACAERWQCPEFQTLLTLGGTVAYTVSFAKLKYSAHRQCLLCRMLISNDERKKFFDVFSLLLNPRVKVKITTQDPTGIEAPEPFGHANSQHLAPETTLNSAVAVICDPNGDSDDFVRPCDMMIDVKADNCGRFEVLRSLRQHFGFGSIENYCHLSNWLDSEYRICVREGFSMIRSLCVSSGNPASALFPARYEAAHPDSESGWALVEKWHEECSSGHSRCTSSSTGPLPMRIIYVAGEVPKLIERSDNLAHYVALSYSWGASQPLKTTTHNINDYLSKGIPIFELPRTIQDAVKVTRKLGYVYLWVDSLCIIQDDENDKVQQLRQIREIFRNSCLTIVAGSAQNVNEGFLAHNFAIPRTLHARLPLIGRDQSRGTVFVVESGINNSGKYDTDRCDFTKTRAWCLEEILLSRRAIVYCRGHFKWLCQLSWIHDRGITYIQEHEIDTTVRLPRYLQHVMDMPVELRSKSVVNVALDWIEVVEAYTKRLLTKRKDKLVAIAAIAEIFHTFSGDEYLAGLWLHDLALHLLWSPSYGDMYLLDSLLGGREYVPQDSGYKAPTWSWASTQNKVYYPIFPRNSPFRSRLEVCHCHIELRHPTLLFGDVTAGRLTVKVHARTLDPLVRNFFLDNTMPDDLSKTHSYLVAMLIGVADGPDRVLHGLLLTPAAHHLAAETYERARIFEIRGRELVDFLENWIQETSQRILHLV